MTDCYQDGYDTGCDKCTTSTDFGSCGPGEGLGDWLDGLTDGYSCSDNGHCSSSGGGYPGGGQDYNDPVSVSQMKQGIPPWKLIQDLTKDCQSHPCYWNGKGQCTKAESGECPLWKGLNWGSIKLEKLSVGHWIEFMRHVPTNSSIFRNCKAHNHSSNE